MPLYGHGQFIIGNRGNKPQFNNISGLVQIADLGLQHLKCIIIWVVSLENRFLSMQKQAQISCEVTA